MKKQYSNMVPPLVKLYKNNKYQNQLSRSVLSCHMYDTSDLN